jgi:hypothetical protein
LDPLTNPPLADPLSLHKYLFTSDDPINFSDPSGRESLVSISMNMMTGFTLEAMGARAAIGAGLGAIDYMLNDDPRASLASSMLWGAGSFVLGPIIPWWIGLPLAGAGLWDAASRGDIDLLLFRGATIVAGAGFYRYISGSAGGNASGSLGGFQARVQNTRIWFRLWNEGWHLVRGGNAHPEEVVVRPNPVDPVQHPTWASTGRQFVKPDLTLSRSQGGQTQTMRVQTIDTLADGVTPTPREATNARLIAEARPNDPVVLLPKSWEIGPPFAPGTTYGNFLADLLELIGF